MSRRSLSAHDFTAVSTWSCWIWPYRMSSTQLSSYVNMAWGPPTVVHTHPYFVLGVLTDGAPCCSYSNDSYSWRRFFMVTLTVTFPLYNSSASLQNPNSERRHEEDLDQCMDTVSVLVIIQSKWCTAKVMPVKPTSIGFTQARPTATYEISGNTLNHILNTEPHQQPLTMTAGWEGGLLRFFQTDLTAFHCSIWKMLVKCKW